MKQLTFTIVTLCAIALFTGFAFAGPSIHVGSPPVVNGGWTGPANDPGSTQGQWFLDPATGHTDVRTHEFYDNATNYGGGPEGHFAISGVVTHLDLCG